jgi:CheY-like chemotaxis protein
MVIKSPGGRRASGARLVSALQKTVTGEKAFAMVPHESNWTRALRVLVVDDEPLICWSIAETLGHSGDVVTEAESGQAAIRALANPERIIAAFSAACSAPVTPSIRGSATHSSRPRDSGSARRIAAEVMTDRPAAGATMGLRWRVRRVVSGGIATVTQPVTHGLESVAGP